MNNLPFPSSTIFNRRVPKQKFYDNLSVNPRLKRIFVEQINLIVWQNKISPTTLSVFLGETVAEIEVILIQLNQRGLDIQVLDLIDKEIPYHILFILEYSGEIQAWIGYKEQNQTSPQRFKNGTYYHTEWMPQETLTFRLEGLTMDALYDNLIRQVAGGRLANRPGEGIQEAVSRDERRRKLERAIGILEKKAKAEKQFNRQVELYGELGKMKRELEEVWDGENKSRERRNKLH
jgi:hypothetical protein